MSAFLLARREAWISHDDGTTASLPAVLSHYISCEWVDADGRLIPDISDAGVLTPLTLAYGHHALDWRGEYDYDGDRDDAPTIPHVEPPVARPRQPIARQSVVPTVQLAGFADLYFIGSDHGPIKIGISVNPEARLRGLQTGYPYKLRILAIVREGGLQECEYHDRFAHIRLHGEWFERTPELLAEIERLSSL